MYLSAFAITTTRRSSGEMWVEYISRMLGDSGVKGTHSILIEVNRARYPESRPGSLVVCRPRWSIRYGKTSKQLASQRLDPSIGLRVGVAQIEYEGPIVEAEHDA